MPLIQVTSGGQRSLLKKKLQVCESQQSCLFVGDQILIFHHNLQINSLKILQCDFLFFFFLILSLIIEVYLWWKLQASLIFLSGRTCTICGWLNTFLPHCIYIYIYIYIYIIKYNKLICKKQFGIYIVYIVFLTINAASLFVTYSFLISFKKYISILLFLLLNIMQAYLYKPSCAVTSVFFEMDFYICNLGRNRHISLKYIYIYIYIY